MGTRHRVGGRGVEANWRSLALGTRRASQRRRIHIGVRPLSWPVVFGPVEAGGAEPVLQRKFGTVDEEQPAKRPERLSAQVGGVLLSDDDDSVAPLHELAGGDQSGQARPDNDNDNDNDDDDDDDDDD